MSRKTMRCTRCNRRHRGQRDWNFNFRMGVIIEVICAGCQTDEEHLEAEVNAAMGPPIAATGPVDPEQLSLALAESFARHVENTITDMCRRSVALGITYTVEQIADRVEAGLPYPLPLRDGVDQHEFVTLAVNDFLTQMGARP